MAISSSFLKTSILTLPFGKFGLFGHPTPVSSDSDYQQLMSTIALAREERKRKRPWVLGWNEREKNKNYYKNNR